MFNNKKQKKAVDTLITKNTTIHGSVEFSGVLYIDGNVVGNVLASESGSMLTIGARGVVEGEVRVPHVSIFGEVKGDIYANEEVELMEKATISGDVYYHMLQMAMGASVNGQLVHKEKEPTQMLEHNPKSSGQNQKTDPSL